MNTSDIIGALKAPQNRQAITIGVTAGTAVVVGAISLKVLGGAAIAAKLIISGIAAGSVALHAKQAIDNGHLDSMVNALEQELANSKGQ